MQLAACTPEYSYYQEYNITQAPLQEQFLAKPFVIREGRYQIPAEPGIGVQLDLETVSYTHLDVYKRQASRKRQAGEQRLPPCDLKLAEPP